MDGIGWGIGPYSDLCLFERARELGDAVSANLSASPPGLPSFPPDATISRAEVPQPPGGRLMTFEAYWRAVTMASLYGQCSWTYARIGEHFDLGPERVRQLVRLAGYKGGRGTGASRWDRESAIERGAADTRPHRWVEWVPG